MQTLPKRVTAPAAASVAVVLRPERQVSDFIYQGMTLAAMLWLLAGRWVF